MPSNCVDQTTFVQAAQSYINRAADSVAATQANQDAKPSIQQGGMPELILPNLALIGTAGNPDQFRYESKGVGLYFAKSGSQPGAEFSIELSGGKTYTKIVPGTKIVANFAGFNLVNTGVKTGVARFIIMQRADVNYDEQHIESSLISLANFVPVLSAQNVGYNSAINVNTPSGVPSASTPALPLRGAVAARVWINSQTAINSVSIRWWIYSDFFGVWYCSGQGETITLGNNGGNKCVSSDWPVGLKEGYVFAEIYANTNLGGTANFSYFLEVL